MLGKTIKEHFSHIHSFNVIQRRQEGYLVLIREPPSLEIKASDRSLYSFQGSNPRPPARAVSVALQSVSSFSSRSNLGDPLGDRGVGKAEELARRVRTSGKHAKYGINFSLLVATILLNHFILRAYAHLSNVKQMYGQPIHLTHRSCIQIIRGRLHFSTKILQ